MNVGGKAGRAATRNNMLHCRRSLAPLRSSRCARWYMPAGTVEGSVGS